MLTIRLSFRLEGILHFEIKTKIKDWSDLGFLHIYIRHMKFRTGYDGCIKSMFQTPLL